MSKTLLTVLVIRIFEFQICFGFWHSDFEFNISFHIY